MHCLSKIRGLALVGLLLAVVLAAAPRVVDAAAPHIMTASHTFTQYDSDGTQLVYRQLVVNGSHFTPNGAVRVSVRTLSDNKTRALRIVKADKYGKFSLRIDGVYVCLGGNAVKVVALDGATNTIANVAYAQACPFYSY
jgi:hypothetical protein